MSALLIHMSYRSVYIILLLFLRCSEPRVLGSINTVIIVTYFAWGHHSVFDIFIVMCECAFSKRLTLRYILCQQY